MLEYVDGNLAMAREEAREVVKEELDVKDRTIAVLAMLYLKMPVSDIAAKLNTTIDCVREIVEKAIASQSDAP